MADQNDYWNEKRFLELLELARNGCHGGFTFIGGRRNSGMLYHLEKVIAKREQDLKDLKDLRDHLLNR